MESQSTALQKSESREVALNEKYLPFINTYIASGSLKKAVKEVGVSRDTGRLWLKKPDIQQMLIDQRNKLSIKVQVEAQSVLKELKSLAFSNIEDYLNDDGSMKKLSEMPNTSAIQELIVTDKAITVNGIERVERQTRIKLTDKLTALKQITENLNLFGQNEGRRPITINFNDVSTEDLKKIITQNDTIDISYQEQ